MTGFIVTPVSLIQKLIIQKYLRVISQKIVVAL